MQVLLDTNSLLWAMGDTLDPASADLLEDGTNTILYSTVSIWEIVIKKGLQKESFEIDVYELIDTLQDAGYKRLDITEDHIITVGLLPHIHKDPFDRLLVAQAQYERLTLLTSDELVREYGISTRSSRYKAG
ncbi:MAG: type II toxin-antitoxin system VapC family toxin [Coriobacteriaceae bacterium]|jgi:PIN domain nuclease of toxin-antitoxin system|nr:type II toxin-antitoxin system VapC family toxin [Coriobacteriaceae bacterium]